MISLGDGSSNGIEVKSMEFSLAILGCLGGKYVHLHLEDLDGTVEGSRIADVDCLSLITSVGAMGKMVVLEVDDFGNDAGED